VENVLIKNTPSPIVNDRHWSMVVVANLDRVERAARRLLGRKWATFEGAMADVSIDASVEVSSSSSPSSSSSSLFSSSSSSAPQDSPLPSIVFMDSLNAHDLREVTANVVSYLRLVVGRATIAVRKGARRGRMCSKQRRA
jgi:hypothetical protein